MLAETDFFLEANNNYEALMLQPYNGNDWE